MAKLYFRYGAMNSGKSTALLQAAFNYEERGHQVLLAKPAVDTKGDRDIVSRLGVVREVDFTIGPDDQVLDLFQRYRTPVIEAHGRDVSCLLVDEAQFLTNDQVDDLLRIALLDDIPVLAYGIRTDFQTVAFGGSRRLLEVAHSLGSSRRSAAAAARRSSTAAASAASTSSTATRSRSTASR
jgi:thymidine kinase